MISLLFSKLSKLCGKNISQKKIKQPEILKYDAFIFDMDGTFINSEDLWKIHGIKLFNLYINELKLPLTREDLPMLECETINNGYDKLVQKKGNCFSDKISKKRFIEFACEYAMEHIYSNCTLYPGVVEIFKFLKLNGKKISVATNGQKKWLNFIIKKHNLSKYFDFTLSYEDVNDIAKPNGKIFSKLISLMNVKKEKVLIFEDAKEGLMAAKKAGVNVWGFRNGANQNSKFCDHVEREFSCWKKLKKSF